MPYCPRCGFQDGSRGLGDDQPSQLGEVEEEILQLEARLHKLFKRRTTLKRQINAQSSPLLRLPTEILREISMAGFPEGQFDKDGKIDGWDSTTPLLLGSICSRWRDIAWSTPRLWTTIYVGVEDQYCISKTSLLEDWLQRSRNLPISVSLDLVDPDSDDPSVLWKILDLVARHSEQWQDVYLDIPYFFDEEKCSVPKSFPQLRRLSILNPELEFGIHVNMFQHAPILNEVLLPHYSGAHFPTSSLSHVTITDCAWSIECLKLLDYYPLLMHCAFVLVPNPRPTHQIVVAPSLRSLKIEATGASSIASLLDNLLAPRLDELTIQGNTNSPFPYRSLISVLQRSACSLVRLTLAHIDMSNADLVECLASIPSLRELELSGMTVAYHAIHELTLRPGGDEASPLLVPQLLSLVLTVSNYTQFDFAALAKMAESRRQTADVLGGLDGVAQMESITVHLTGINTQSEGLPTLALLEQFRELEAGGMKVDLRISD